MEKQLEVKLNKQPAFTETWYEGAVVFEEVKIGRAHV